MKKTSKGFTLIELLAVIIILAIVALIATPIVLDVVDDARKSAAKSQTAFVLDAAKLYYAEEYIKTDTNFEGYECSISNRIGCDELSLEGEKPDSAIISIDKNGRVNGKVVVGKYTNYICNNKVTEEETAECSFTDYIYIYEITSEGIITGFKTVANTAFLNIVPIVNAEELTDEALEYLEDKEITIPEYVGDIEVKGIAENAFASYDIETVTILSNKALTIGANAFPESLTKLRVSSCLEDSYSTYSDKLELIERDCETNEVTYKCKRATTLHTEQCKRSSTTEYCGADGYYDLGTITYGQLGASGILNSGDAFDCDVNGDGIYDAETERFYYVSDLESNTDYAVLVYYSNTALGVADNSAATLVAYDSSIENWHGPVDAVVNLPTTSQWSNISLSNTKRAITNELGTNITTGGTLPTDFSYAGYAARLLTAQEVNTACGITIGSMEYGELNVCNYLMENTKYSNSSLGTYGYWLETPLSSKKNNAWHVFGTWRDADDYNVDDTSKYGGTRPAIEVLKTNIEINFEEEKEQPSLMYKCKRATELHTEICSQTDEVSYCSGAGYTESGLKGSTTITYGQLGTKGALTSGDAYDCDVNGDGRYDSETERFYYVSDVYNTKTKTFESDFAVLIYYSNTTSGIADNTKASKIEYDLTGDNWYGPRNAKKNLPTTSQWSNVQLFSNFRTITTQNGTLSSKGKILPTGFNYTGYAARFLTTQELNAACGITVGSQTKYELDVCTYLFENMNYSDSSLVPGYWLENVKANSDNYSWHVYGAHRYVGDDSIGSDTYSGVRPVIEVLKENIEI